MNHAARIAIATRAAVNAAVKSARMAYRITKEAKSTGKDGSVRSLYEAGRRWQWGDRSYIWSFITDARFDASQADRLEMLRKSRYFEANSPLVQRIADLWEQYTVGPNGLVISPATADEDWGPRAKLFYDDFCLAPDLCSLHSMSAIQSLASRQWLIDGEVFILLTRTLTAPYKPRIQLIESHRVGTPPAFASQEGKTIIDGVQVDAKGKPIFYWVQTGLEMGEFTPVPAENIIHVFEPSRVGQLRGLTYFYAVMNQLHDLDDLMRLEMGAAKDAARTSKVIKTASGELPEAEEKLWEQSQETLTEERTQNPAHEYYERVFGPETKLLMKGDTYEQFLSNRPSVAQQWYWKFLIEQVCSGVGVPLVMVFPDTMQGTVYRGALDVAAGFFRSRSKVLGDAFMRVRNYALDFGSRFDVTLAGRPADWMLATCRPPRSPNVDVGRNSSAMLAEIKAGARTFSDVYGETGEDWQEKLEQRAKEASYIYKLAKKYAVPPQFITEFAVQGQSQQKENPPKEKA